MSNKKYRKVYVKKMKQLIFDAYNTEVTTVGLSHKSWVLLWQAINNPNFRIDSREKLRKIVRLLDAFATVNETITLDGEERVRLKPAGADLILESELYDLLKQAWESYYPTLPASYSRDILAVDGFLSSALEVVPTGVKQVDN